MHLTLRALPRVRRAVPVFVVVAAATLSNSCADAQTRRQPISATAANVGQVLAAAKAGDVIVLQPGVYRNIVVKGRTYAPHLSIDASRATIEGVSANRVDGLEIKGGQFRLPPAVVNPKTGRTVFPHGVRFDASKNIRLVGITMMGPAALPDAPPEAFGEGTGVLLNTSENVEVIDSKFAGLKNGIVLSRVSDFRLLRNTFENQRSDGITIGEGRSGLIEGNECKGTRMRDNEHPDCIQLFSRPTSPPTADIVIRKNRAVGATQGIGMANHVRNGVNDGGYDRILIEENDLNVGFPNGISLRDARASVVRNNRVQTFEGAKYWARINISGDGDVLRCGNVVKGGAGKRGETDRPC